MNTARCNLNMNQFISFQNHKTLTDCIDLTDTVSNKLGMQMAWHKRGIMDAADHVECQAPNTHIGVSVGHFLKGQKLHFCSVK